MTDEDLAELHYSIYEEIEMNRLYPHKLLELYAEYRARALNSEVDQRDFWLSACRKINSILQALEGSRRIGTAFADHELPLRKEV